MRRLRLTGLLVLALAPLLPAQQQPGTPDGPAFRASTELLTIDAVVTDADGKPVTNLTRDDFEVTVAGKHQTLDQAVYIRTQEQPQALAAARAAAGSSGPGGQTRPPARIEGLGGARGDRHVARSSRAHDRHCRGRSGSLVPRARSTCATPFTSYIDTQIEPGDLVAIIRTAGGVGALQQFTTDKRLLHLAADRLQWDFRSRQGLGDVSAYTAENTGARDVEGTVERAP